MGWKIPGKDLKPVTETEKVEGTSPWEEPEAPPCTVETPRPYWIEAEKRSEAEIKREIQEGFLPRQRDPYPRYFDPNLESELRSGLPLPANVGLSPEEIEVLRAVPVKPPHACPDCDPSRGIKGPRCTGYCRQ
jgi:hypothetical protein